MKPEALAGISDVLLGVHQQGARDVLARHLRLDLLDTHEVLLVERAHPFYLFFQLAERVVERFANGEFALASARAGALVPSTPFARGRHRRHHNTCGCPAATRVLREAPAKPVMWAQSVSGASGFAGRGADRQALSGSSKG